MSRTWRLGFGLYWRQRRGTSPFQGSILSSSQRSRRSNAHLATDAGAGLLASGAVLLVAAWLGDRRSAALGTVAFACFAVPHAAYHVLNPAQGLDGAEDVRNALTLVFVAGAALVLLVAILRATGPSVETLDGSGKT